MKQIRTGVAAFIFIFFSLTAQHALAKDEVVFKSGVSQNTFIELYTSDSNVNGNPVLEWMSDLKQKEASLGVWANVVAISMHVNLWDVPGYKDSFARKPFDERLLSFKKKWSARNVYCPTMIVNGVEWSGWSRGQPIPVQAEKKAGELVADGTKQEGAFEISFTPEGTLGEGPFTIHGTLVAFGLKSKPSEGKNRGKSLQHDFVVMLYRAQDLRLSYGKWITTLELVRPKAMRAPKFAAVFWVTKKDDPQALQAVGGYLPL